MSFPRKEATAFLVPQSWLTSLFVRHWCNFCSFVCSTSQKTFHFQLSSAFFRWWCWRKVLPSYLWRKTFWLQFTLTLIIGEKQQTAESVFIQYCAEKTNQQNWKESFELKIAPKTKNQYSCRRGCQNINLACRFLV